MSVCQPSDNFWRERILETLEDGDAFPPTVVAADRLWEYFPYSPSDQREGESLIGKSWRDLAFADAYHTNEIWPLLHWDAFRALYPALIKAAVEPTYNFWDELLTHFESSDRVSGMTFLEKSLFAMLLLHADAIDLDAPRNVSKLGDVDEIARLLASIAVAR